MEFKRLKKYKLLQIIILLAVIISFSYGFYLLKYQHLNTDRENTIKVASNPTVTPLITPTSTPSNKDSKAADDKTSAEVSNNDNAASDNSINIKQDSQNVKEEDNKQIATAPGETPVTEDKKVVSEGVQSLVEEKASTIVSKPVSSGDFVTAASTILGKLNPTEMMYIFNSARSDFWVVTSVEEINNIRSILFSKLTDEDLNTLISLGKKYGRSMSILDKNIDVEKAKATQVELAKSKEQK